MIFLSSMLILFSMGSAHAFEADLDGVQGIDELRSQIINAETIEKICRGDRILREDARRKRMEIASEFETRFEDYKLKLRQLGDDIVFLNDMKHNLRDIKYWETRRKEIDEAFDQKIHTYLNNNSDVYIPLVYASFVELPITYRQVKYRLIRSNLLLELIERYGVEKLWTITRMRIAEYGSGDESESESDFRESVRSKQRGTIEQDGVRNFEYRDLVYRTPEITKCLTVGFYRFKPFALDSEAANQEGTGPVIPGSLDFRFKSWNLADEEAFEKMKLHIKNEFEQYESFLTQLEKYLNSLGDLSKEMERSKGRIAYVLQRIESMNEERKNRLEMADLNINRLKDINEKLKDRLDISGSLTQEAIEGMIREKRRKKAAMEKDFQYRFVFMAESPESRLETAVRHSLESVFDELGQMIKKQTMSIETVIENGVLQDLDESLVVYKPEFKNIYIRQYLAGQNAGVIVVLDVKYDKTDQEEAPQSRRFYVENAAGMELKMVEIKPENAAAPFYISETEITKSQFFEFLESENMDTPRFFKGNCEWLLSDYPEDYPMLRKCIPGKAGIEKFLNWLNKESHRPYKYMLPSEKQIRQAISDGINPGRSGFRIVGMRSD
ncbi:MAG: hypothetical protein ACOC90_00030 [Bacteroidota bacterium]